MTSTSPRRRLTDPPALLGVLFWVIVPLFCVASLGLGIKQLTTHRSHLPKGVLGSFVVTTRTCADRPCSTAGTFTSSDGSLVLRALPGDERWLLDRTYGAIFDPRTAHVLSLPGTWDPSPTVIGMVGAVVFLAVWVWCLRRRRAR